MGHGHVGDSLRECHVRVNQCAASLERLENRMRTQNWYHELPDQESDDAIDRMVVDRSDVQSRTVMRARVPARELDRWVSRNTKEEKPVVEPHWLKCGTEPSSGLHASA